MAGSDFRSRLAGARGKRIIWRGSAIDFHVREPPSAQAAIHIFKGEWQSRLPPPLENASGGEFPAFEDERIAWAIDRWGGLDGAKVVELGPLEGGHTFMLHEAGARSIVAVEANTRAFLRCLVVKEILDLSRARFVCGDLLGYLRETDEVFDVCLASGVLYHLLNPVELIALSASRAQRLFLWTHYFDPEAVAANRRLRRKFAGETPATHEGFSHQLHRYRYGLGARLPGFPGGSNPTSHWLSRADILGALEHFGWRDVEVGFDQPDHPTAPALALVASR